VEGFVLARGETALQVFGVGQRSRERRIRGTRVDVYEPRRAHVDQLTLQVADDPRGRQRGRMPREADGEAWRQQAEEPSRVDLSAGQTLDAPAPTETAHVLKARRQLFAEWNVALHRFGECDSHLRQVGLDARCVFGTGDQRSFQAVRGRGTPDLLSEAEIGRVHVVGICSRRGGAGVCIVLRTRLHLDHGLERRIDAVDHAAERREPAQAVVFGRARESNRAGLDNREGRFRGPDCGGFATRDSNQRRQLSLGTRHRMRYVARQK
jgi:hypothetical protein